MAVIGVVAARHLGTRPATRAGATAPMLTRPDPTSSPTTAAPPSTAVPVRADGTYAVGTTSLGVAAPPLSAGGPSRELSTTVWYPALAAGANAVPERAGGPYPLLVFSQGYPISVQAYGGLLAQWASAGYVVAAPRYTHTTPTGSTALTESFIVVHPADLRDVITTVLATAREPGGLLSALVNPSEVGLAGHSDGGDVSLAVAESSCCQAPTVKAVAVLSGAELASFGGTYFAGPTVPILVVQGSADTVNVPACSTQIYDAAGDPKFYVDLLGAQHEPPYIQPGPDERIVAQVTTDFFDAELAGEPSAATALLGAGSSAGVSSATDGPSAPPAAGSCPGA